jgi:hypothetical protein
VGTPPPADGRARPGLVRRLRRRPRHHQRRPRVEPGRLGEHLPVGAQLDPDRPVGAGPRRVANAGAIVSGLAPSNGGPPSPTP